MKKIVDTIKKMAQLAGDPPPAPRYRANRPTAQNSPAPKPAGTAGMPSRNAPAVAPALSSSVPAVKEMQSAILNLANAASSSDATAMSGNKDGLQNGPQSRAIPNQTIGSPTVGDKEFLGGNDPFGQFIVQNYMQGAAGKQYLNTDVAGGVNRDKASIPTASLRGMIDTMKRIGTPGSSGTEKSVDGIWQTRTNNALHVAADLIGAMLKMITDMKIPVVGYTDQQLAEFKKLIPASYTELKSPTDLSERAKALTPHLAAMATFFNNLKPAVFDNKQLKKYIDQKEPFAKYTNTNFPNELQLQGIPGITFGFVQDPKQNWISLRELSTMDNFKRFVERTIGPTAGENPETVKKVLDMVAKKLNTQTEPGY